MWVSKIVFMVAGFIWFLPLVLPDNLWPLCRWPQSRKQSHFIRSQWSFVYLRNVRYTHPWSQSQTETKLFLLLFFFSFPDCAPFVAGHLSKHSVISQWTPDHSTQVDIRSRPPPPPPPSCSVCPSLSIRRMMMRGAKGGHREGFVWWIEQRAKDI